MPVTVNVNGLSVVHQGSEGVSRATLPDVCVTPPTAELVPYANVAYSRDLRHGSSSVKVDGHSVAHESSVFDRSYGDEPGRLGGVASGTTGGQASWLTHSFDVRFEGQGVCRLTDKMLQNAGNTVDCAGLLQRPVARSAGAHATRNADGSPTARAAKKKKPKLAPMEIALPFFTSCMVSNNHADPAVLRQDVIDRARALGVTYFRMFMPFVLVSRPWRRMVYAGPNPPPKVGTVMEPFAEFDRSVKAVTDAGFGVELTVHGGASPWTHGQGLDGGGVDPKVIKFANYFARVVDRYKAKVKRFSVWNEPNHPGFLRAGPYWKSKDGKARLNTILELKALQHVFENAKDGNDNDDPAKVAAAIAMVNKYRYADDLEKLSKKNGLPAYPPANRGDWAKLCDDLANKLFPKALSRADNKRVARAEDDKPGTRYSLFNLRANARTYRAIYDACWKRTKNKGVKIWLGELSSGSAFAFIDFISNPKITGTRRVLKADALALHPYQYLIPPTKKPTARPLFPPPMKVDPAAPAEQQSAAKAWNEARRVAMSKKWPMNPKKRKAVREKAASNAGIGAISVVQGMLRRFAKKPKRITGRDGKKLDLYLTEFGYHRLRPQKLQFDRQVPEERRARWVKLAYDVAYRNGAKQNLYYHLLASWELHEWDSALLDNGNAQTPTFDALADWVAKGKLKNKVKTTVD